ncbi:hypothetical protein KY330_01240, partial [Candidatus Woesearchaeota archaeon]|nr:hypothetical protein [Candidatus Woesearchaeota archaeon]
MNWFKDTTVTWNAYVCDASGNCAWANENETFSGWDLGSYYNVTLNSTSIALIQNASGLYENTSGYYESRVYDSGFTSRWLNLTWDE